MICQATYESLESIPEALREEFEQKNGKWQLKETAIPGVGPLFNAALAANSERQLSQLAAKKEDLRIAKEELVKAQDKLAVLDSPGNKVLSKADAETWEAYTKLGTPQEIEKKVKEHGEISTKLSKFETGEALRKVTAANGLGEVKLNPEVLTDWLASEDAKGVTAFVKTVEVTDAKGAKTNVEVPYARIEKPGANNSIEVSERELLPFAKEVLPEWKYSALVSGGQGDDAAGKGKGKGATTAANGNGGGVRIPDLGSARKAPDESAGKERPIDRFNKQREDRPNPFAKSTAGIPIGQPVIRDK